MVRKRRARKKRRISEDEDLFCFTRDEMREILKSSLWMMDFIVGLQERLLPNRRITKENISNFLIQSGIIHISNDSVGTITGFFMDKGYDYHDMFAEVNEEMQDEIGFWADWPKGIRDLMED